MIEGVGKLKWESVGMERAAARVRLDVFHALILRLIFKTFLVALHLLAISLSLKTYSFEAIPAPA